MIVFKLVKVEVNQPEVAEVSVELTDNELDAIYSAMSDYRDYGDDEEDTAISIQEKISKLFSS
jgi:uncharacterized membrane-anchored protein